MTPFVSGDKSIQKIFLSQNQKETVMCNVALGAVGFRVILIALSSEAWRHPTPQTA